MTRCHPLTPAIIETDDCRLEGILPAEFWHHGSTVGQAFGQQPACEASSEENLQDRAGMEEVPGSLMAEERVTENEWES
ncbi:hypothetical protein SKAU_G00155930 [Synaphobranchus kaupii]|uniref:Uncharacterized protein n=1 Tax=Synaphobranchus kaupii TaxID=118154 RepID=A0A9Q1FHR0_SYNKA|nr:hypothetical protein SKAU_G00155930 [Synaphobranchus kaupii]